MKKIQMWKMTTEQQERFKYLSKKIRVLTHRIWWRENRGERNKVNHIKNVNDSTMLKLLKQERQELIT